MAHPDELARRLIRYLVNDRDLQAMRSFERIARARQCRRFEQAMTRQAKRLIVRRFVSDSKARQRRPAITSRRDDGHGGQDGLASFDALEVRLLFD